MEVKTYKDKSIQGAIRKIKEDLGPDALILSTKRLPAGPRNPYAPVMFEVCAVPHTAAQTPGNGNFTGSPANREVYEPRDTDLDFVDISGPGADRRRSFAKSALPEPAAGNALDAIRSEIVSIKDMLFLFSQVRELPDMLNIHPECLNLYARLIKAGISEKRTQSLLKKSGAFSGRKGAAPEAVSKRIIQEIMEAITTANPFETPDRKMIAAFVGPTGVGKTTTIAKLAADLSFKQKRKVGIISIDSYRIGAIDQLKTYAAIMGLPCLPAFTKEDLEAAIRSMRGKDIILIDTAGQSHLDLDRLEELARLIHGDLDITAHLVLSATAKPEDMEEAAKNFMMLSPSTYVFTKLDETRTCGNIIDQAMDLKMPISFVTNGQNVPEDILPATKKTILRMILS